MDTEKKSHCCAAVISRADGGLYGYFCGDGARKLSGWAEKDYKTFSASLVPGVEHMLGVRLPKLRQLAKQIAGSEWQQYLAATPYYFEELMLQGMVIGAIRVTPEERLCYMADFVPRINSCRCVTASAAG